MAVAETGDSRDLFVTSCGCSIGMDLTPISRAKLRYDAGTNFSTGIDPKTEEYRKMKMVEDSLRNLDLKVLSIRLFDPRDKDKAVYQLIAAKTKSSAATVGKTRAASIRKTAAKGTWVQLTNGTWKQV